MFLKIILSLLLSFFSKFYSATTTNKAYAETTVTQYQSFQDFYILTDRYRDRINFPATSHFCLESKLLLAVSNFSFELKILLVQGTFFLPRFFASLPVFKYPPSVACLHHFCLFSPYYAHVSVYLFCPLKRVCAHTRRNEKINKINVSLELWYGNRSKHRLVYFSHERTYIHRTSGSSH